MGASIGGKGVSGFMIEGEKLAGMAKGGANFWRMFTHENCVLWQGNNIPAGVDIATITQEDEWRRADISGSSVGFGSNIAGIQIDITAARIFSQDGRLTSIDTLVKNNSNIVSIEISEDSDMSNVTTAYAGFARATSLTDVDLSSLDFSALTSFRYAFLECYALKRFKSPGGELKFLTSTADMFNVCPVLESAMIYFSAPSLTDISRMFANCTNLRYIDISNIDTRNIAAFEKVFSRVPADAQVFVGEHWALTEEQTSFEGTFIRAQNSPEVQALLALGVLPEMTKQAQMLQLTNLGVDPEAMDIQAGGEYR